jgi:glycosyltransferase involved in cell wall biosynthesis
MKKILIAFMCFFLVSVSFAEEVSSIQKSTVCLNMIVKNEKNVITRCLQSVLPLIDTWVIVDTGSTDGTQEIIKDFLKNIPGELHERPWVNFAHNRNEALDLAKNKADYILLIDADDIIRLDSNFKMPSLTKDFYQFIARTKHHQFRVMNLIKSDVEWRWYGVIHEYLQARKDTVGNILEGIEYVYINDGSRSKDPLTYQKDIALLEEAVKNNPSFPRNYFYLARTYLQAGEYEKAIEVFKQRSQMGGWIEEVFASKLSIGQLQNHLKKDPSLIKQSFIDAYLCQPLRSEPIYYLLEKLLEEGSVEQGFHIAKAALDLPKRHQAALFEETWVCDYGIPYQYALCAARTKRFEEGRKMCKQVLAMENLPQIAQEKLQECLTFIEQEIEKEVQSKIKALLLEKM